MFQQYGETMYLGKQYFKFQKVILILCPAQFPVPGQGSWHEEDREEGEEGQSTCQESILSSRNEERQFRCGGCQWSWCGSGG